MLNQDRVFDVMVVLIALSLFFRLAIKLYYRDGERILPKFKLSPGNRDEISYYKRFDTLFAPLPFIYCWLEIFAAVLFFRWTDYNVLSGVLLAVVTSGRMRALQELGHNALHLALCPSKKLQWFLSNTFFQFPTLKRDMDSRFITHVIEHHPNADVPGKDPNLRRVIAAGMVPASAVLSSSKPCSIRSALKVWRITSRATSVMCSAKTPRSRLRCCAPS